MGDDGQVHAHESGCSVIISLVLRGDAVQVNGHLRSATRLTCSPLLVHIAAGSGYWGHTERWLAASHSSKVYINPSQLHVPNNGLSLLRAHMSNIALVDKTLPCVTTHAGTRLLFMSSGSLFFRPGVEAWMLRHAGTNVSLIGDRWWRTGSFYGMKEVRRLLAGLGANASCGAAGLCSSFLPLVPTRGSSHTTPYFERTRGPLGEDEALEAPQSALCVLNSEKVLPKFERANE